jgi:hypothetical protein
VRTSFRSPWQNGVAERWVGSCRRDLLDHVIPLGERHLKRLLSEYVRYYHADRTHMGRAKDTPDGRDIAKLTDTSRILSFPRAGRLASSLQPSCLIATIVLQSAVFRIFSFQERVCLYFLSVRLSLQLSAGTRRAVSGVDPVIPIHVRGENVLHE